MSAKFRENREIAVSFTDAYKACLNREFLAWQLCLLTLFAKFKFSRKILNLHFGLKSHLIAAHTCLKRKRDRCQNPMN